MPLEIEQGSIIARDLLDIEKVIFLLPVNGGPFICEYVLDEDISLRVVVMTDDHGRPTVGITHRNSKNNKPPEPLLGFEHDRCFVQKNIQIGVVTFTAEVELNWSGVIIDIYATCPDYYVRKPIHSRRLKWK